MAEVKVGKDESIDRALRRFKRSVPGQEFYLKHAAGDTMKTECPPQEEIRGGTETSLPLDF